MRLNTHQVQQLMVLSDLMDVMRNPGEVKQMIKELHEGIDNYNKVVEKERKIKDIDKWSNGLAAKHQATEDSLLKQSEAIATAAKAHEKLVHDHNQSHDDLMNKLNVELKTVEDTKASLANVAKEQDKVNKHSEEVRLLEADVLMQKQTLEDRLKKVEALLGDKP